MAIVKPIELTPGLARNQALVGRVRMLESPTVGRQGKTAEYAELHLLVEEGLSGSIFIEAWRDQARRLTQAAQDGSILTLTNITLRSMGDKAQWQCTKLDVYGQVLGSIRLEEVEYNGQYPTHVHTVLLRDLPMHTSIPHLVNLAAVFVEVQQTSSTKATAPAYNMVMADEAQSVRVAVWRDHAGNLDIGSLDHAKRGQGIVLTSLKKVTQSKESTTELCTSRRSRVLNPTDAMAETLQVRTRPKEELSSLSRTSGGHTDYSTVVGTPIHLRALTSLIVPQTAREFAGEVFEVFHCLVEDLEPLPDAEDIFYQGCPVCKKKSEARRVLAVMKTHLYRFSLRTAAW